MLFPQLILFAIKFTNCFLYGRPIGETKVLVSENGEDPEAPFLGQIEPDGKEIQQAIVNNLFRAPIFRHQPHPTDFLLIRTKKGDKRLSYCVREIPYLFLCGQLEPQQAVPRPMTKITTLQEKFYLLAAARFLQSKDEGVPFFELQKALLRYWCVYVLGSQSRYMYTYNSIV